MIYVVNRHTHKTTRNDLYCGRGLNNVLGNDWDWRTPSIAPKKCSSREEAIANFKTDFLRKITEKDEKLLEVLRKAYKMAIRCNLNLVCFCAPDQDCHARVIKEWLEQQLP